MGKAAIDTGWNHGGPPSLEKIDEGWNRIEYGVGLVVPDGHLVIDVEASGLGWWDKVRQGRPPVVTRTARTGGGGLHLWFRLASGQAVEALSGKLPEGAGDVKLPLRGYVVAPPSVHPDTGRRYEWIDDGDISELPGWLYALITRGTGLFIDDNEKRIVENPDRYRDTVLENACAVIETAPTGARNNTLFKEAAAVAGVIKALGGDMGTVSSALVEAGTRSGMTRWEVERTVTSALSSAKPAPLQAKKQECEYIMNEHGGVLKLAQNAIIALLNDSRCRGRFRFDSFNGRKEVLDKGEWRSITDFDWIWTQTLLREVTHAVFKDEHVRAAIGAACMANQVNELTEWLGRLRWDGVCRLDRLCPDYLNTEDTEYTRAVGRTFCISAVARALRPGCKVDTVPILVGAQGVGKSTAIRTLAGESWFRDSSFDIKDHRRVMQQLSGVWVYEMSELAAFATVAAQEQLKAFITSCEDSGVPPYGREVVTRARSVVFFGTSNDDTPLRDRTGNRRYLILKVLDRIDLARISADREQLWAEAVHRFSRGESWVLPEALWGVAADVQAEAVVQDPWVDILADKLAIYPDKFITASRLYGDDYLKLGSRASTPEFKKLKACMKELGWEPHTNGKHRGYKRK